MLAGMFALDGRLRERYPSIVDAILQGTPCTIPDDLWFGVALVDGHRHVEGGGGQLVATPTGTEPSLVRMPSGLLTTGGYCEAMPYAAICWPPLSLVLHDSETAASYPHQNYGGWLSEEPSKVRDVDLLLTAVRSRTDGLPTTAASFGR